MSVLRLPAPIPSHDTFSIALHTVVDTSAIIANLILLLAIVLRSPEAMRSYAVLLANNVLIDLIAAFASLMVMIRMMPVGDALFYVYYGPCTIISSLFCHYLFVANLATILQSIFLIAVSFAYRLHVLVRDTPRRRSVLMVCALIYVSTTGTLMPVLFILNDTGDVRRALALVKPEYALDDYVVAGHLNVYHWTVLLAIAVVLAKICEQSGQMSDKTMKMHRILTKVLSIQSVLPIFFIIGGGMYCLCQFKVMESTPMREHLMFQIATFIPLLSPTITLCYIQPYRSFVTSCFRREVKNTSFSSLSVGLSRPMLNIMISIFQYEPFKAHILSKRNKIS